MNALLHLMRADFFERTRRYSYLIVLGLVLWLGYLCADGTLTLRLDQYRGVFNSAWVGAMMALVVNTFLGLFGFYVIKGSIARDLQTGVGQILAATPLRRVAYVLGKWLSNFAVLGTMVLVLAVVAVGLQFFRAEDVALDLGALLAPFLFVSLPAMALIAALAVLFEVIPFLRGGAGNVVYFFGWTALLGFSIEVIGKWNPALDINGMSLFMNDMQAALRLVDPTAADSFSLGMDFDAAEFTFLWTGLRWTADILLARLAIFGCALGVVLVSALFFDRFAGKHYKSKTYRADDTEGQARVPVAVPVVPLMPVRSGFNFFLVLWAELKLALKGQRWWWYVIAAGLVIAPLAASAEAIQILSGFVYIWPLLIWSALGNREARFGTHQLVFSAPQPLLRQLPASWLVGALITLIATAGVGLNLLNSGPPEAFFTWGMGVLFIPTLALTLGIWSGSPKVFEVVYVVLWYLGPLNNTAEINFINGPMPTGLNLLLATVALLVLVGLGRQRQLQGQR